MNWRATLLVLAFCFGAASLSAQEANPPELTVPVLNDDEVALSWTGHPDWVLQRSTLREAAWETILSTRGQSSHSESRRASPQFFRLVQLPEMGSASTSGSGFQVELRFRWKAHRSAGEILDQGSRRLWALRNRRDCDF